MALFVNSFTFSGFVGQDAEVRRLPSGHDVCNFSVALCKRKKEDPTLWLTIAAYGKTGEFASKLRKSDQVVITGVLYQRCYTDKNGNERSVMEVNATSVAKVYADSAPQSLAPKTASATPTNNEDFGGPADEDLPF